MANDCIFCKIIKKEVAAELLYQDELVSAFRDAHPLTPVHVLIVPNEHIVSIADTKDLHEKTIGRMVMTAKKLAEDLQIAGNGYKLLFRVRRHGGQEIDHVHLHLLGGALLSENIHPV